MSPLSNWRISINDRVEYYQMQLEEFIKSDSGWCVKHTLWFGLSWTWSWMSALVFTLALTSFSNLSLLSFFSYKMIITRKVLWSLINLACVKCLTHWWSHDRGPITQHFQSKCYLAMAYHSFNIWVDLIRWHFT